MENANGVLLGKTVLNVKGVIIGRIQESIKDSNSGESTSVLIKPSKMVNLQAYSVTDRGEIIFLSSSLSHVKDKQVLELKERQTQMGHNAREQVIQKFSWDTIAQKTSEIYKEFMQ